jgi:tetratricopeptide (TPR) repeat protein
MKTLSQMYNDIQPLIDNGWHEAAIAAMEKLLADHPTFAQGHHDLGALCLEIGNKEKAGDCFEKAVNYEPQNNAFLKSLADYYHVQMEDVDKSLAIYNQMIENGAQEAEIFFIAANLSLVKQHLETAIDYYEKVLDIQPWHAEAFEYLEKVKAYLKNGNMKESTSTEESLYEKAVACGIDGRNDEALALLEQLIALEPENALAHNDLGVIHHRLGNEEKSLTHYRTATTLEPFNSNFQKNLADSLCFIKGEVIDALTIYLRLLKEDPEDVDVLMAAGHISQAIGRPADAELFYERVVEIEPWNMAAGEKLDELQNSLANRSVAN